MTTDPTGGAPLFGPRPLRTRVKFCGMTREGDIHAAAALGVDAIGLVFAQRSRRLVSLEAGAALRAAAPPMLTTVALFMDNPVDEVREVIARVRPDLLQFHGSEDAAFCVQFGVPYLKAIAMGGATTANARAAIAAHPDAAGFLFDSHAPGAAGGSGHAFDWSQLPHDFARPALLAGGLSPDNVFEAVRATGIWGVDVSSGIESAPGEKDPAKMRRFVEEVRRADRYVD